jgi:hypothetical protein
METRKIGSSKNGMVSPSEQDTLVQAETEQPCLRQIREKMERLQKVEQRIARENKKRKQLNAEISVLKRKQRTRQLIEQGAILESVLGRTLTREELPVLKKILEERGIRDEFLAKTKR